MWIESEIPEASLSGMGRDASPERHGLGIVTMRERAELVGGTIEFMKPSEGGTLVRLHVPAGAQGA